jgi:hypothetical protein
MTTIEFSGELSTPTIDLNGLGVIATAMPWLEELQVRSKIVQGRIDDDSPTFAGAAVSVLPLYRDHRADKNLGDWDVVIGDDKEQLSARIHIVPAAKDSYCHMTIKDAELDYGFREVTAQEANVVTNILKLINKSMGLTKN